MTRGSLATLIAVAALVLNGVPAGAWDPDDEDRWAATEPEPHQDPDTDPDPIAPEADPIADPEAIAPAAEGDAEPLAPPPDLYYVTETYVADVVTKDGPRTTYATETVHESTGTYARVLESLRTGEAGAFDGRSFNGRAALRDGRAVAGTYYENFVRTERGFVPVSVVFFQDDTELAFTPATPRSREDPTPPCCPVAGPDDLGGPDAPSGADPREPRETTPGSQDPERPEPIRPGVSLLPASAPLGALEVIRGRPVSLWFRAFSDEREIPVRSWSLVSGEAGRPLATSGRGGEPFRTSWERLAPAGTAFVVRFRLEVASQVSGHRFVEGAVLVTVRAPALDR